MFVDEAVIEISSGAGGNGCVSFRREKFAPKGGPDGGDGGNGGRVIVKVVPQIRTLVDFRFRKAFRAGRGRHGQGNNKTGRQGRDVTIRVPRGTVMKDSRGRVLADLVEPGEKRVLLQGGRGGRGNARFATSTNQAPRRADPGRPATTLQLHLELKLLGDVGLVGLPNAGKSTILARVSSARPKVAAYPFTTLAPWLGVVRMDAERSFVMVDLPGLIEGAHAGKGLGHVFLRHIERTRVLVLVIDVLAGEVEDGYQALMEELRSYSPALVEKPRVVALNKIDLLGEAAVDVTLPDETFWISGLTGKGVREMLWRLLDLVLQQDKEAPDFNEDDGHETEGEMG
ncbi:MAG: GTPase ObgE [Candidatus Eisenbacteria sp.]|nr:GTPase ObgE [Candidatus Eisenbacteria bacterium]